LIRLFGLVDDDIVVEGVDGEAGEYADEHGNQSDGNYAAGKSAVVLLLAIAKELRVTEEVHLLDNLFDCVHSNIYNKSM
jgi:hypothetical protein